jgi:hypothetical protein
VKIERKIGDRYSPRGEKHCFQPVLRREEKNSSLSDSTAIIKNDRERTMTGNNICSSHVWVRSPYVMFHEASRELETQTLSLS